MSGTKDLPGTADEEVIQLFERLRAEEYGNCRQCQEEAWGPKHFLRHSIIETDGGRQLVVPTGSTCGGNGRRFDVEQRQFVGNTHCTCDACF